MNLNIHIPDSIPVLPPTQTNEENETMKQFTNIHLLDSGSVLPQTKEENEIIEHYVHILNINKDTVSTNIRYAIIDEAVTKLKKCNKTLKFAF